MDRHCLFDFTHNAMFEILSDHPTRPDIPENPMVQTQIATDSYSVENTSN